MAIGIIRQIRIIRIVSIIKIIKISRIIRIVSIIKIIRISRIIGIIRISKIIGIIVAVAAVPAASWWSLCSPQLQREGQANQIRMDPISLLATKAHPLNARSITTASYV